MALPQQEESGLTANNDVEECRGAMAASESQATSVTCKKLAHVERSRTRKWKWRQVRSRFACAHSFPELETMAAPLAGLVHRINHPRFIAQSPVHPNQAAHISNALS